jgi:site-specific DNA-cytosine methylase
MNVLSLFDGMSCGQLALRKANKQYDIYLASEIEPDSIKVAMANFPGTIQLGDVTKVTAASLPIKIDLLIGGSPCQGFSNSGDGLNFSDPRSKLFFEFVRLLKELKPKYFLLENVVMKKEWELVITSYLGVEPIKINSSLFVPQNRPRLYWTNIPVETNRILGDYRTLKDILLPDGDERLEPFMLSEKAKGYMSRDRQPGKPRWEYHTNPLSGNAACLTANMYKGVPYGVIKEKMRRLHPIECERLQGVPDNYTSMVSNTSRYKMLGNGWTIDVIAHIMSFMEL